MDGANITTEAKRPSLGSAEGIESRAAGLVGPVCAAVPDLVQAQGVLVSERTHCKLGARAGSETELLCHRKASYTRPSSNRNVTEGLRLKRRWCLEQEP